MTDRNCMRTLIRSVLAIFIALTLADGALAAPPIWKVTSPTATLYLFGTIHLMSPDTSWRTPALDDAYAKSSTLWFETDVASPGIAQTAQALVLQYGLDPDHPLSSKLDAAHFAALKAALAPLKAPEGRLERFQPWVVSLMVLTLPMVRAGFDPNAGADIQLETAAAGDHKIVRTFETAEQQVKIFADMPQDAQVQMLDEAIDESAKTGEEIKAMEAAWLSGDLQRLGPLLIGEMKAKYPADYDAVIQRRNVAWVATLAGELGGANVEMVNVGALHMVGPDGLPALLQAKGFKVERLQ